MSRGDRIGLGLFLAYIAVAVFTFGFAAAHHPVCVPPPNRQFACDADSPTVSGLAAAVLWPLYWSWEAWS